MSRPSLVKPERCRAEGFDRELRGKRITIIDPSEGDRYWFALVLRQMRLFPCIEVYETAIAAMNAFRSRPAPDLVLIEHVLPLLDFEDAVKRLRRIPGYENLPIAVFVSGEEPMAAQRQSAEIAHRLFKPVSEQQICRLFAVLFGKQSFPTSAVDINHLRSC